MAMTRTAAKRAKSSQQELTTRKDNHSTAGSLPPFHSLLSIDSGNKSSAFNSSLPQSVSAFSGDLNGQAVYRDIYPNWDANMSSAIACSSYSAPFNATDEFFFTAQQMAAQLFDQYHTNQPQDCAFYQQPPAQQQSFNVVSDDQLFYPVAGADNSNGFHQPAGLYNWPAGAGAFNQNISVGNTSDSSFTADERSLSAVPTKDSTNSSSDRSVFMLPPPIHYRRRNERERERVRCVNDGYSQLREMIPMLKTRSKRISKVETLRAASRYIRSLQEALGMSPTQGNSGSNGRKK